MVQDVLYNKIQQMEPMFPTSKGEELSDLSVEVIRQSAALGERLHPVTRRGVVELVRTMNSYYSNLIEGHNTHPADIERAMARDYSHEPAKRALQVESVAHIDVQRLIEQKLVENTNETICSHAFLCWIHQEFYERIPDEFREVEAPSGETKIVIPGKLREDEVEVGRHIPPASGTLVSFLKRFEDCYGDIKLGEIRKVIAAAAAHHRLAWIHPFLDGNGRVTRLFTHAYLVKARIDGHGLWTVSRGLARNRAAYMEALAGADEHRRGDLDGRGNLSNKGLLDFCTFFLRTALDQITFMSGRLELDGFLRRLDGYVDRQVSFGELQLEAKYLLREAFFRGEVPRGEVARITGKPDRTARRILKDLLEKKLLTSDSERAPVRLAFPTKVAGYYFPQLYPEGVEMTEA
ncbi:Fic family protein [Desulfuromusa kysingii]|uniref:Fic family protein n=1 Tax=Desulfuromusa kysingii TaxID=37625 RepID=A0A1H4DB91_9BACT|nr:Fic family protein [Desulfuromusa kysingii]SEA70063.1 Fic family protein [Desulfuromusa kysingii]